ncbi:5-hydroxytryptamine receptor 3A-like [Ranitomeya variabilis]|uniref:5-hydroxytryptamine receptor 3A-like n=1 Tax=Ranitomeya variabilis TaxID=490064 RepID=UPI004057C1D8
MTLISIPMESVWFPDIQIAELVDSGKLLGNSFVYIDSTGLIKYQVALRQSFVCMFYIFFYPFDAHNCTLSFYSQLHTIEHINLSAWVASDNLRLQLQTIFYPGEWELSYMSSSYRMETDEEKEYAVLVFHIIFKRLSLYYVVNLIVPSVFLMILDIIGFYLPNESGERISFKITLLLGYSVFLIIVMDILPASSHTTPIIDIYFVVCMALLGISLAESILIFHIVSNKNSPCKVPMWVRKLVLERISKLIHRKNKHCDTEPNGEFTEAQEMSSASSDKLDKYPKSREPTAQPTGVTEASQDVLENIFKEIVTIRKYIKGKRDQESSKEWILIGHVLDKCLFWAYLLIVLAFIVSIAICWSNHMVI